MLAVERPSEGMPFNCSDELRTHDSMLTDLKSVLRQNRKAVCADTDPSETTGARVKQSIYVKADFPDQLDLEHVIFEGPVVFDRCKFKKGVNAKAAHFMGGVSFLACNFGEPYQPNEIVHGADDTILHMESSRSDGPVVLHGSTFHGSASFVRSHFEMSLRIEEYSAEGKTLYPEIQGSLQVHDAYVGAAVDIKNLQISGDLSLRNSRVKAALTYGITRDQSADQLTAWNLDLHHVRIEGDANLRGISVNEIQLTTAEIGGDLRMDETATHRTILRGLLDMKGASIGGHVLLSGADMRKGIDADGTKVQGAFDLNSSKSTTTIGKIDDRQQISVQMRDATVGTYIDISGVKATGAANFARLNAGSHFYANRGKNCKDECNIGTGYLPFRLYRPYSLGDSHFPGEPISLCLAEAHLRGSLRCQNLITSESPLLAEGLNCFSVFIGDGSNILGTADFSNAKILGNFIANNARLSGGVLLRCVEISGSLTLERSYLGVAISEGDLSGQVHIESGMETDTRPKEAEGSDAAQAEPRRASLGAFEVMRARYPCPSLDLTSARIQGSVVLSGAQSRGGISADFSQLKSGVTFDSISQKDLTVIGTGFHQNGQVYSVSFVGAEIKGFQGRSAIFHGGIDGASCNIEGDLLLSSSLERYPTTIFGSLSFITNAPDSLGLSLRSSRVNGQVQIRESWIGAAICLLDAVIDGTVDLDLSYVGPSNWFRSKEGSRIGTRKFSIEARCSKMNGPLRAQGCFLSGDVILESSAIAGCKLDRHTTGEKATLVLGEIRGSHTHFAGSIYLTNCLVRDGVDLSYSRIDGSLDQQYDLEKDPSQLWADYLTDNHQLRLKHLIKHCEALVRRHIPLTLMSMDLSMDLHKLDRQCGCLRSSENLSLMYQNLYVNGSVHLRGFSCSGGVNMRAVNIEGAFHADKSSDKKKTTKLGRGSRRGRIFSLRLSNAQIKGYVAASGLECDSSVSLQNAVIGGDVYLDEATLGFGIWRSSGLQNVALLLERSDIGGSLNCSEIRFKYSDLKLSNSSYSLLKGNDLTVGNRFTFVPEDSVEFTPTREGYLVEISRAKISGSTLLALNPSVDHFLCISQALFSQLELRWMPIGECQFAKSSVQASGAIFAEMTFKDVDSIGHSYTEFFEKSLTDFTRGERIGVVVLNVLSCVLLVSVYWVATYPSSGDGVWSFALAPLSMWVLGFLIVVARKRKGPPNMERVDPEWEQFWSTSLFLKQCEYSQSLMMRVIDLYAKQGLRLFSDLVFEEMKEREYQDRELYSAVFSRQLMRLTRISTSVFSALILFLSVWGECSLFLYHLLRDKASAIGEGQNSLGMALAAMGEVLKMMLPFAGSTDADLVKKISHPNLWVGASLVAHVIGFTCSAVIALYVAGLFRRHKYSGALD